MGIAIFILVMIIFLCAFIFLVMWRNIKNTEGKMVAEIWEPNGFPERHLVKPDPTGDTITWDNLVYRMKEEKVNDDLTGNPGKKEEIHQYPSRRYVRWPSNPPMGLKFLQAILRIESWERDNPEPIRPFYGRVTKDGKFDDSQLTVTSTEWQAQKSVIQATGIAMSVQEREAREKEWQKMMANIPNRMIIYIGLGACILCSVVAIALIYQLAGMM